MNVGPQTGQNRTGFHPPSVNFAFCIVARRCTRETGTQPSFAKREEVNSADASRIRWRRIVNANETIKIRLLVSRGPKHIKLAMASRRAACSGNTELIATFLVTFVELINMKKYE